MPESSTLYVISKGKVQKIRPTGPPIPKDDQSKNIEATPPKSIRDIVTLLQKAQLIQPKKFIDHSPSSDDSNRYDMSSISHNVTWKRLASLEVKRFVLIS